MRMLLSMLAVVMLVAPGRGEELPPFRVGISQLVLPDVRDTDIAATVKVWGDTILFDHDTNMEIAPKVYSDTPTLKRDLHAEKLDLVIIRAEEYFAIEDDIGKERMLFYVKNGRNFTKYLLISHRDSGIESWTDLKGKSLVFAEHARLGMGKMWLETLTLEQSGLKLDDYCKKVAEESKGSRTVMSVFFGKSDACVVTRSCYETMVELNPQIGKTVRTVEVSPDFVPALMCIHKNYSIDRMKEIYQAVKNSHEHPRGRQMLTTFKLDRLEENSDEHMKTTRIWFERHAALVEQFDAKKMKVAEMSK